MSNTFEVPVSIREGAGKGNSRRLRRQGLVPSIMYGGDKEPISMQVSHTYLLRALQEESFYTSILEVKTGDGKVQKAILRDLQRHPHKQQIMHVDFQRVSDRQKLHLDVPVHFVNEAVSPASKKAGVVVSHLITEVEVSCLPKDLPEFLELDLTELDVGGILHLSDITLPSGVELTALAHDGEDAPVATASHVTVAADATAGDEDEDEQSADGDNADHKGAGGE